MFRHMKSGVYFDEEYSELVSRLLRLRVSDDLLEQQARLDLPCECGACWGCNMGGCQACEYGVPHMKTLECNERHWNSIMNEFSMEDMELERRRLYFITKERLLDPEWAHLFYDFIEQKIEQKKEVF